MERRKDGSSVKCFTLGVKFGFVTHTVAFVLSKTLTARELTVAGAF
jgi:hypothetical protein